MSKKDKIVLISERVGEIVFGLGAATVIQNYTDAKCKNKTDALMVTLGGIFGTWYICRKIGLEYVKVADDIFDTNASEYLK